MLDGTKGGRVRDRPCEGTHTIIWEKEEEVYYARAGILIIEAKTTHYFLALPPSPHFSFFFLKKNSVTRQKRNKARFDIYTSLAFVRFTRMRLFGGWHGRKGLVFPVRLVGFVGGTQS